LISQLINLCYSKLLYVPCKSSPKTPSSLASFISRLVLPFSYRLTQVVLEKRPLNWCSLKSVFENIYSMDDWPIAREYSTRNRVANFVWSLADCCSSFRHLRFVNKEALLSCDLPMAPSSFRAYVKERCKELNHFLQRRSRSLCSLLGQLSLASLRGR